jgi:hypothetical protein
MGARKGSAVLICALALLAPLRASAQAAAENPDAGVGELIEKPRLGGVLRLLKILFR